ncbi:AraC family transcriptional regulator [Shewanella avicenniae]|uniref:AraC family transcriptional regulator n=1 Tax=Shewanella avicenniae TaxID=2814294 RepID=A0ABX7QQX7_9GAMM|nr:AraC family transcriptional regulator [Shewanella avicenniae]QSX33872.1 AraC family transcriptional regulator [Shewanella avicenniae]
MATETLAFTAHNDSAHTLANLIAQHSVDRHNIETPIDGLFLGRWSTPTPPVSYTHRSCICLIAQGSKQVVLGEQSYVYDPLHCLVSSVELPVVANIIEASEAKPYLGLSLDLDLAEISQLISAGEFSFNHNKQPHAGLSLGKISPALMDAFIRLVSLLNEPDSIKVLGPMIKREIYFRLLNSEQGARISQIVATESHSHQITHAINWLKRHYSQPLNIGELAADSGMSKSAFYTHFRAITSMTPLQFQKKLRLSEARRLMLTENLDAMSTSFQVGYESPSQFSREYRRQFGAPPLTDIRKLKESDAA